MPHQDNKEATAEGRKQHSYQKSKGFYCSMCDIVCEGKSDLQRHFKTIGHNKKRNEKIKTLDRFMYHPTH